MADKRDMHPRNRRRASAACTACRKSRIRCILKVGQKQCCHCTENGFQCLFDDKDGRKEKGSAKAVADGLKQRIEHLERLLQQQAGSTISPTSSTTEEITTTAKETAHDFNTETPVQASESAQQIQSNNNSAIYHHEPGDTEETSPDQASIVQRLLPSHVRFDLASGRVRCFGPTTNMSVLSVINLSKTLERRESHWPLCLILRDLSPETHEHLMELFWTCHNSVHHLVHTHAFYEDLESGGTKLYSTFLHMTMLAIGFRYADKTRPDIQRLAIRGYVSSTIHAKAKSVAKLEMEKPGGLPSILALILLSDLECSIGRDDTGWMYFGMAARLVFDVGLHVDPISLNLNRREAEIRHMVLWASILHDKYWSLYLGRPTSLKASDMAPTCLSKDFGPLISCRLPDHEKSAPTRVYEALLHLMELVGPLCDLGIKRPAKNTESYLKVAVVDRELTSWYSNLADDLRWSTENASKMPMSYLLLHSQYHAALILLHRPFIQCNDNTTSSITGEDEGKSHFAALSRSICVDNAKKVAEIFQEYKKRFDITKVFLTGLQHAGTAATALMAEIVLQKDHQQRRDLVDLLSSLRETLILMSKTYQPAVLMSSIVDHFIRDYQHSGALSIRQLLTDHNTPTTVNAPFNMIDNLGLTGSPKPPMETGSWSGIHERNQPPPYFNHLTPNAESPQGLPYLPASFFEGLGLQDAAYLDLVGPTQLNATSVFGLPGFPVSWDPDLALT